MCLSRSSRCQISRPSSGGPWGFLTSKIFSVAAILKLVERANADNLSVADIRGPLASLLTAISRTSNDAICHTMSMAFNIDMTRRQAALKSSDQIQEHRKESLMGQPLLSSQLFS